MTPRRPGETQRAYVERILRDEGSISTFDALYSLAYADGRKCSITRLAAIVFTLRQDGWTIADVGERGTLAMYRLVSAPSSRSLTGARVCPSCHRTHPVGTTCSPRWTQP